MTDEDREEWLSMRETEDDEMLAGDLAAIDEMLALLEVRALENMPTPARTGWAP